MTRTAATRATARDRVRTVAIVVYLVLAVLLAAASVSYASDNADLRRDGVSTAGTVVDLTYRGRARQVDGYVVRYAAPVEGDEREGVVPVHDGDPVLAPGDQLDLLVNPAEPDDVARLDSGPDDTLLWVTRVLAVLSLLGAIAAATRRAPRLWGGTFFPDEPAPRSRQ